MSNPFVFGVPVEGANFTDREKEKREILDSLVAAQNLILFAPRRYGKSSLLREVMRGLDKKKFFTLWIDVSEVSTVRGFLETIINQINEFSKVAKLAEFIKTTLPKYEMLLDQIKSKDRKAVLFYLAEHGSKDIFGMDSLREMEVRNPNGVNYALKVLMEKEILEKSKKGEYRFVDPFFAFYLRKKGRGSSNISVDDGKGL